MIYIKAFSIHQNILTHVEQFIGILAFKFELGFILIIVGKKFLLGQKLGN